MNDSRTFFAHVRTGVIVTLITVMVWLLAESRMVRDRSIEPQLVLTTLNPDGESKYVVRQILGQEQIRTVSVSMTGSIAGLDRFARVLQSRVELRVGRDIPAEPGIHVVDLKQVLRDSPELAVHGLIITQVSPATVSVEVDEVITLDLPIRVELPQGVELDGVPSSDPAFIQVVGPRSSIQGLSAQEAVVQILPEVLEHLSEGRLETIPGALVQLPGDGGFGWDIETNPSQVDIRLTLKSQTARWTIARLPIQVLIAPGEIGKWNVQIADADKDLINVLVEGPDHAIEQIRSGDVQPRAVVMLSFEDLGRGLESTTAQILGLPSGCKLLNPEFLISLSISKAQE